MRLFHRDKEGVRDRVAGNKNGFLFDVFLQKVFLGLVRRRKMQSTKVIGEDPVGFFREGIMHVVGTQSRFHMSHGDFLIKRGQRRSKRGDGVPVNENDVWLSLFRIGVTFSMTSATTYSSV